MILVGAVLLTLGGVYTASNMEVDVFPDLNAPTVVVMTEAHGMAAEEVERLVTFPIETAVNGATNVRRVRSSSSMGFSIVWVEFDWGTDIYLARQIVSEKLSIVGEELPSNVGKPTLGPQSSILGEMMIIALRSDTTSLQDLRTMADWTLRPLLLSMGGVAQVAVIGGEIKEYQILVSPTRMKRYGVTLDEVLAVTRGMNRNASGGTIYQYGNEYIIRGVLLTDEVEQMAKAVVKTVDRVPVKLEDIADVKIGNKAPKLGLASHRGEPAVILTVTKQPATNTRALTARIDAALENMKKSLPADVEIATDLFRQSRFIDNSIGNVKSALFEGAIFVVIVLFLFLMNVRTTVISLVTIPLSILFSILTLRILGLTINTMSLGGIAIAIGSLVDDAIVDVENIFKRLKENRQLPINQQKSMIKVVYDASREVRMPILNSTLIIVASFVPLFFLSGMEGRMLVPLGIAFITSLFASTLTALTLTPVLCSYMLKKGNQNERDPFIVRSLKGIYLRMLSWVLSHKMGILIPTAILFAGAIYIYTLLGHSFLPPFNEGSMTVNVSTLPGVSLEESDRIGRRAEEILLSIPEVKTTGRKTGRAELDEHSFGINTSEIEAPFELKDRSKDEMLKEVRAKMATLPGVNVEIGQPISHRIDAMLSGTKANIAIKIFGSDLTHLFKLGNDIKTLIADIPGIADLNVEQQIERPQLQIKPRRDVLAKYGVPLPHFAEMVNVLLGGEAVCEVYDGNRAFDLTLKVADADRATIESIGDMLVDAGGRKVPFSTIAEITSSMGPNTINRENVSRKVVVSTNISGADLRGVVDAIRERVDANITLPEGYHVEYGGQFESEQAASRTLMIASIFAILVIFLLLYNEFRNVPQAAVIMLNLPLALIGGVFTIYFTDKVVSIPSIIGFISLFGIATRNGMLLISRYNDLMSQGMSLGDAVLKGSIDRLNPILMTALTSALALIPLALGGELPGNEIQSPMAKVLLGGLLSSTLLNGFVVPIMYTYLHNKGGVKFSEDEISE